MRRIRGEKHRGMIRMAGISVLAIALCAVPVSAAESVEGQGQPQTENSAEQQQLQPENMGEAAVGWRQVENTWYYYDESGVLQTGWILAPEDGLWYCLDSETGSWVKRPALDTEAAVHLLENAIKKMGYYQNEEHPVIVTEDGRNGNQISLSVRIVTGPNDDQILNHYEVNRKSGRVNAAVGENFNLYD